MATKKKSFLLYKDSLCILDELTDDEAGKLFKAIAKYQIGESQNLSAIVKMAFFPFKNQFIRDDEKYQALCEKNKKIADNRHGKDNPPDATKSTTGNDSLPDVTKSTDKDKDKDKDTKGIREDNETIPLKKTILDHLESIYGVISQMQYADIAKVMEQIDDVEEFGKLAKEIYNDTDKGFKPSPVSLSQKVFAEIKDKESTKDNHWRGYGEPETEAESKIRLGLA